MAFPRVLSIGMAAAAITGLCLIACSERGGNFLPAPAGIYGVSPPVTAASGPPMILPLEVDISAAEQFVRIGFGLEPGKRFHAQSFLTTRLRTIQAQALLRIVKSYNSFEGDKVADVLGRFRGKLSAVEFGLQGAPVLFIELPHWTHQREETVPAGMGTRISEEENKALEMLIEKTFIEETSAKVLSERGRRMRIWWQ